MTKTDQTYTQVRCIRILTRVRLCYVLFFTQNYLQFQGWAYRQ